MMESRFSTLRLAVTAALGALILEAIVAISVGINHTLDAQVIPAHLAALLVGALAGWLFELFRELTSVTREATLTVSGLKASVESLTQRIKYQDQALDMLMTCPRHHDALTALIKKSMSDNFRNIPLVGVSDYLAFLQSAVRHADGYEGVQRQPLRWYRDRHAGPWLVDLRQRKMQYKRRLIVLDNTLVPQMRGRS